MSLKYYQHSTPYFRPRHPVSSVIVMDHLLLHIHSRNIRFFYVCITSHVDRRCSCKIKVQTKYKYCIYANQYTKRFRCVTCPCFQCHCLKTMPVDVLPWQMVFKGCQYNYKYLHLQGGLFWAAFTILEVSVM